MGENPPMMNQDATEDRDFSDIPLDVPINPSLMEVRAYRQNRKRIEDNKHITKQKAIFDSEFKLIETDLKGRCERQFCEQGRRRGGSANGEIEEEPAAATPPPPNQNAAVPQEQVGGVPFFVPQNVVVPVPVSLSERECKRAAVLRSFRLTCRDPFGQGNLARLPTCLHDKILCYITGVSEIHSKSLWFALRSSLSKFDIKRAMTLSPPRAQAIFLQRYSSTLFEQLQARKRRKTEDSQPELSFEDWQETVFMADIAKKCQRKDVGLLEKKKATSQAVSHLGALTSDQVDTTMSCPCPVLPT